MLVMNSSKIRKSLRVMHGAIAVFPPGISSHINDSRIMQYVKSHPDLSVTTEPEEEKVTEEIVKEEAPKSSKNLSKSEKRKLSRLNKQNKNNKQNEDTEE